MGEIAFLGLGSLGAATASRLVESGHKVTIWNRSAAKTIPLTELGATAAATPAEAVAGVDTVFTMLADTAAVETVLFGPDGIAQAARPGTVLVEMSTIGPDAVKSIRERLPEHIHLIDGPVAGGPPAAASGKLRVLAGGDAADIDRVEPTLNSVGSVLRCGPLGSGAALKLVVNVGIINGVAAVAEALALADSLGLPDELAVEVLKAGPIGGAVARAFDPASFFRVALAVKDLKLATGVRDLPVTDAVIAWMEAADQDDDLRTLVRHAKEQSREGSQQG